jgi:hypothetical protein
MATLIIQNPTNLPEAADTGYMRQNAQIYAVRTGYINMTFINNWQHRHPRCTGRIGIRDERSVVQDGGQLGSGRESCGGRCYVYAVPNEGGANFQYSVTAPAWNIQKGGWYNGNNRSLLRFEYVNGAFNDKVLMDSFNYDADLNLLKLLGLIKEEFEEALGALENDLGELGGSLSGLGEALTEGMKKMAGFDIPPDSAVRTLAFRKATQGEGSITLSEGMYEVRMRGGKGFSPSQNPAGKGADGGLASGYFKISQGTRTVYVDVGGNATSINGGYGGGAGGGGGFSQLPTCLTMEGWGIRSIQNAALYGQDMWRSAAPDTLWVMLSAARVGMVTAAAMVAAPYLTFPEAAVHPA